MARQTSNTLITRARLRRRIVNNNTDAARSPHGISVLAEGILSSSPMGLVHKGLCQRAKAKDIGRLDINPMLVSVAGGVAAKLAHQVYPLHDALENPKTRKAERKRLLGTIAKSGALAGEYEVVARNGQKLSVEISASGDVEMHLVPSRLRRMRLPGIQKRPKRR